MASRIEKHPVDGTIVDEHNATDTPGEELINLFAMAMKHGITATEIRDFIYGFPTFSAEIKSML